MRSVVLSFVTVSNEYSSRKFPSCYQGFQRKNPFNYKQHFVFFLVEIKQCCNNALLPIQKSAETSMSGQWQVSPQRVKVRYQEKKGSQHTRKAPITTPSVTNAWKLGPLVVLSEYLYYSVSWLRGDRLSL